MNPFDYESPELAKVSFGYLKDMAGSLAVADLAAPLLNDVRFPIWSGSSKPTEHHYGKHGLVIHTAEVVRLCFLNAEALNLDFERQKIYLAALYHDAGKMWDYRPLDSEHKEWECTPHLQFGHVFQGSHQYLWLMPYLERLTAGLIGNPWLTEKFVGDILHAILAHHGLKEWNIPVSSNTQLAWLLHLCDSISARMNNTNNRQ